MESHITRAQFIKINVSICCVLHFAYVIHVSRSTHFYTREVTYLLVSCSLWCSVPLAMYSSTIRGSRSVVQTPISSTTRGCLRSFNRFTYKVSNYALSDIYTLSLNGTGSQENHNVVSCFNFYWS